MTIPMRRLAALLLGLAAVQVGAGAVRAHYVWVVVERGDGPAVVRVGLGETPDTIDPTLAEKVAGTEVRLDGRAAELKRGDDGLAVRPDAEAPGVVEAVCDYGVIERGGQVFALHYSARSQARPIEAGAVRGEGLDLAWVAGDGGTPEALATWRGEPLAGAVVKVFREQGEPSEAKTDARGRVVVPGLAEGRAAVLVRHVEPTTGRHEGKDVSEARHYATLTVASAAQDQPASAADSEADAVLQRAHDARVSWGPGFPGFTADLTLRTGEQAYRGKLRVSPEGEVSTDLPDGPAKSWAERHIRSLVMHRGLRGPTRLEPGAKFLEPEGTPHPLGRLIELAGDGMGSAYRIKGDEITEVNRTMGTDRFSTRVLANIRNAEGKLLPLAYTVAHWNDETGQIERVETYHATWTRVGRLDLPATQTQVVVGDKTSEVRRLEFSNHRLLDDEAATASTR